MPEDEVPCEGAGFFAHCSPWARIGSFDGPVVEQRSPDTFVYCVHSCPTSINNSAQGLLR